MRERGHLIAPALFFAVGLAALDDCGVFVDESWRRKIGYASFNYILGDEDARLDDADHDRFCGIAFKIPLIIAERALGLEDSRHALPSRRLLTHAFFLAAAFSAWLLAYRLFGSRLIAPLAALIFLLRPRICAHSFFNAKDLPFPRMFMIALYLVRRAFRRTVWAFALCGAGEHSRLGNHAVRGGLGNAGFGRGSRADTRRGRAARSRPRRRLLALGGARALRHLPHHLEKPAWAAGRSAAPSPIFRFPPSRRTPLSGRSRYTASQSYRSQTSAAESRAARRAAYEASPSARPLAESVFRHIRGRRRLGRRRFDIRQRVARQRRRGRAVSAVGVPRAPRRPL